MQTTRIQPHNLELEMAVLGVLMNESALIPEVMGVLHSPECFYASKHAKIYEAIVSMYRSGDFIDMMTITEKLRKSNSLDYVGGPHYLAVIFGKVTTNAHVIEHAAMVAEKFMKRQQIKIAGELLNQGYDDTEDVFHNLDAGIRNLQAVTESIHHKDVANIHQVYSEKIQEIQESAASEEEVSGYITGFHDLDRKLGGLRTTRLIILAARPGIGKTAFSLNVALNASDDRRCGGTILFSMEMSKMELMERVMAIRSGITMDRITEPKMLDRHDLNSLLSLSDKFTGKKIFIDDTSSITWIEMRNKVRKLKMKHNIGLVVVDYLQLMGGDKNQKGNREQEISQISRELKKMAKDFDVCVIALSQMSRDIEKRGGEKRPMLSDLRESGAIEQDANQVIFLYQPSEEEIRMDAELANGVTAIVAKNRQGKKGDVHLTWDGSRQTFGNVGVFNTNVRAGFPVSSQDTKDFWPEP